MDEMGVLKKYTGVLMHDFWPAYAKYSCQHAYCNAHIIRELQGVFDGFKQEWAKDMRKLLEEMYSRVFKEEAGLSEAEIQEFGDRYDKIVGQGELANPKPQKKKGKKGRTKNTKGGNLVNRLKKHKHEVLRFLTTNGEIPFTNNQAERDIRMMKVQQKISGTFRTETGATEFAIIRGYISTMRKQDQSVFQALKGLPVAQPVLISSLGAE